MFLNYFSFEKKECLKNMEVNDNNKQISSSSLENEFKIAQILQMQKRFDQAIKKYKSIINSFEIITRQQPNTLIDYSITALSIGHLVEIYKSQNDLDRALSLLSIQKKFIEHISASKPTHQNNSDPDIASLHEQNVLSLFDELNTILNMPSMQPKKPPEEIINDFLKEKEKQDKKAAEQNMLHLLKLVEEKKRRLENSRFERWSDWINNNPIAILIFAMIFLSLFLLFIFTQFKLEDKPNRKVASKNMKNTNPPDITPDSTPRLTKEEFRELSEKLKKISDEKLKQTLDLHKDEFNLFVDRMKKRYQKNVTKSDEL